MNINDLGWDASLDVCCRNHDLCPNSIKANQEVIVKYTNYIEVFTNNSGFTRSDCRCDIALYDCLVNVGFRGAIIWTIYVTTVQKCFNYRGNVPVSSTVLEYRINRWLQQN